MNAFVLQICKQLPSESLSLSRSLSLSLHTACGAACVLGEADGPRGVGQGA